MFNYIDQLRTPSFPIGLVKTEAVFSGPPVEESCKIWSVHLSFRPPFCLPVSFLRICSLVFSETKYGVRGPYVVVYDRTRFFGKNPCQAKMTESSYGSLTFCKNCMLGKNLVLKL